MNSSPINSSITIRDILITGFKKYSIPTGEYNDKSKKGEPENNLSERLYNHISNLIQIASEQHKKENFNENTSELDENKKNNITRLITNEFYFYTYKPLTVEQFKSLMNKVRELAKEQPENLHLILGSFAVKTSGPNSKIMNVVPHVQCGKNPILNFTVKNNTAVFDPYYIEKDEINKNKKELENIHVNNKDDAELLAKSSDDIFRFEFNNVFECKTSGGVGFYSCTDICLDHEKGVAKQNLLAKQKDNTEIKFCSHVVVSNSTTIDENKTVSKVVSHSDPKSPHTRSSTIFDSKIFGTPSKITCGESFTCNPVPWNVTNEHSSTKLFFKNLDILNISKNIPEPEIFIQQKSDENILSHTHVTNEIHKDTLIKPLVNDKELNKKLRQSVMMNKLPQVKECLLKGADPNEANLAGHYPLVWAVSNNDYEIVKALLEHGANPYLNNSNESKTSAWELAQEKNNIQIINLIEQHLYKHKPVSSPIENEVYNSSFKKQN